MAIKRILFSPELLVGLTRGRYEIIANETPADAEIVAAGFDRDRRAFYIELESEGFDVVGFIDPPIVRRLVSEHPEKEEV